MPAIFKCWLLHEETFPLYPDVMGIQWGKSFATKEGRKWVFPSHPVWSPFECLPEPESVTESGSADR